MYIGMKVDLIASRRIKKRDLVQDQFFRVVELVILRFADNIAARMIITHGDEAQALFYPTVTGQLFEIIEEITDQLEPYSVRFGFGVGTLTTPLQNEAIGMDGVVWHRAQEALQEAKKKKQPLRFSFPSPALSALNALANMLLVLSGGWTRQQQEVIKLTSKFATQREVAKYLGISPAAVSQRLHGAHYDLYKEGKEALAIFLGREINDLEKRKG